MVLIVVPSPVTTAILTNHSMTMLLLFFSVPFVIMAGDYGRILAMLAKAALFTVLLMQLINWDWLCIIN